MNEKNSSCCTPSRATDSPLDAETRYIEAASNVEVASEPTHSELRARLVDIPGGFFDLGARKSKYPGDLDSPRQKVQVKPFKISPTAVTNNEFARFVNETGYRTVAEIEGWSYVFHLLLDDPARWTLCPPGLRWWRKVDGAYWEKPEGPSSSIAIRHIHPVVHMTWYDAHAYCRWSGLKLPSEVEWERAARGGLAKAKFPWGNAMLPGGKFAMNTWQGSFPDENTAMDGFVGTSPVDAFASNGYGLYNTTGNVWEWVEDRFNPISSYGKASKADTQTKVLDQARVQRGGSYLCHDSYCDRYHVDSRTQNDPVSSAGYSGFRVSA